MHADHLDTDIHTFLERHQKKDLMRFVTVGSVDDGKSTMIGRLLHDTGAVYEDHLEDARGGSEGEVDLARITDGLRAEREQGITIDVAYRYFTTAKRKFIIADTPGHIQYTRNMATGASTADLAIILIDARNGVLQQSRRHAYIASLLGIPYLLVAVNKMDAVDYDEARYREIHAEFEAFSKHLNFQKVLFLPISALVGDNVVEESSQMPWYEGPTLLQHLEGIDLNLGGASDIFRYPVQYVLRPDQDYRGFAGQIASGVVRPGDSVKVLPSGHTSTVKAIDSFEGELEEAFAPMSVSIRLSDEIDVSRGDLLVHEGCEPELHRRFRAMLVWMGDKALDREKTYLLKHGTQYVRAEVSKIVYKNDLRQLEELPSESLELNDIGCVEILCHRPIAFDAYLDNRVTGSFILIDSLSNFTAAAGMILQGHDSCDDEGAEANSPHTGISVAERKERLGHEGLVLCIADDGAGKTTRFAYALEREIFDSGALVHVVLGNDEGAIGAIRTCVEAGLLTICVARKETQFIKQLQESLEKAQILRVTLDADSTSSDVCIPDWNKGFDASLRAMVEDLLARKTLKT